MDSLVSMERQARKSVRVQYSTTFYVWQTCSHGKILKRAHSPFLEQIPYEFVYSCIVLWQLQLMDSPNTHTHRQKLPATYAWTSTLLIMPQLLKKNTRKPDRIKRRETVNASSKNLELPEESGEAKAPIAADESQGSCCIGRRESEL